MSKFQGENSDDYSSLLLSLYGICIQAGKWWEVTTRFALFEASSKLLPPRCSIGFLALEGP